MFADIKGIAYDLDGTITDTGVLHEKAWQRAASELGLSLDADFLNNQKGLVGEEAALLVSTDPDMVTRFSDRKRECVAEMTEDIRVHPEFFETNDKLRAQGIQTWICTSAPRAFIERLFALEKQFSVFKDQTVYREMYERGKPDAEPLRVVFSKMNLSEQNGLYIGDAHADYQAAKNAGCGFVYFCPGAPDPNIPSDVPRVSSHSKLLELI